MNRKIFFLRGIPGSGKTTWTKKFIEEHGAENVVRINKDSLRESLSFGKYSKNIEKLINEVEESIFVSAYMNNIPFIIIDNTHMASKHEERFRNIFNMNHMSEKGYEFIVKTFEVDLQEAIKRDLTRGDKSVGEKVIRKIYDQGVINGYIKDYRFPEKKGYDSYLPDCIIFDLDGTTALKHEDRSWYDAETSNLDYPNSPVIQLIQSICNQNPNLKCLAVTGREYKYIIPTKDFLYKYKIPFDTIFMRKTGDFRPDEVVKKEIYEEHIKNKFNVLYVFDDRNSVVNMWRNEGLTCLQVANGDF